MTDQLKPCPLCGSKSSIFQSFGLFHAGCTRCFSVTKNYRTQDEAVRDWNNRENLLLMAKPCPFCGGKAKFYQIGKDYGIVWKVMCGERSNCSALLNDFGSLDEAVNAWNRRFDYGKDKDN